MEKGKKPMEAQSPARSKPISAAADIKKPGTWPALFREASYWSIPKVNIRAEARIKVIHESSSDEVFIEDDLMESTRLNWTNCLYVGNDKSFRYPKRRFIFEHYWFEYQEVEEIIKNNWMSSNLQTCNMLEVSLKLRTLGKELNDWAKQSIGQLEKELEIAKLELIKLDRLDEAGQCNDLDICKMRSLSNKIMALKRQVHIKWWSKARSR
ncbi:hypothetical protein Cni_G19053 [Canna indica]|uniref:Uncharacterized protein n=1 Tax=Canna indica TaxID=4628 RepID=A0AAQ3KNT2_9LILI|nr:hypothetical protein Cni_G19053 [Canna indica]